MNEVLQRSKKNLKNKKGFTLIELIVVIVIIGILAAIVIPNLAGFTNSAKIKADVATARTLATAAASAYADDPKEATYNSSDAAINAFLPDGFDWNTEIEPGTKFNVEVTSEGSITVKGADSKVLYPTPATDYGKSTT